MTISAAGCWIADDRRSHGIRTGKEPRYGIWPDRGKDDASGGYFDVSFAAGTRWVPLPGSPSFFPSSYTVNARDPVLPYEVRLTMAERDNWPTCVELSVLRESRFLDQHRFTDEVTVKEIAGGPLRRLPVQRLVRIGVVCGLHDEPRPWTQRADEAMLEDWDRQYEKIILPEDGRWHAQTEDFFARVAALYINALPTGRPAVHVREALKVGESTAFRYIARAVERGYLTRVGHGRPHRAGPRLERGLS